MASFDLEDPSLVASRHAHFSRAFNEPSAPSANLSALQTELALPARTRFLMTHGASWNRGKITNGLSPGRYTPIHKLHDSFLPCETLVVFACHQEPESWFPIVADGTAVVTYSRTLWNVSINAVVSNFAIADPEPTGINAVLDAAAAQRAMERPSGDYFYRRHWRVAVKGAIAA